MGTLSYTATNSGWQWTGYITINYTTSYDAATNSTTVTFSSSNYSYFGRNNYGTSAKTTITVSAGDNTSSSGTSTFNLTGHTNGGTKEFTGTPSPTTVTVQHSDTAGAKTVTIAGPTTIKVYASSTATSQITATGSGSTSETIITTYLLTYTAGTGSSISVNRTTSSYSATLGNLGSGSILYPNDSLTISFTADTGYDITTHTVNDSAFTSGGTYTVSGNVTVVSAAKLKEFLLSLSAGNHSAIDVTRTNSNASASIGTLTNGATIYYGDVLVIVFGAARGYELKTATVNGNTFTSGNSHTVTSNVTIVTVAASSGVIYIDNGSTIEKYQVYVDNGSSWDRYIPYVDDGTKWNMCG